MMDPQTELTALEAAYLNFLNGGAVASYTIAGRSITRFDMKWIAQRMDLLRAQVGRQQTGMFFAAQNRRPE